MPNNGNGGGAAAVKNIYATGLDMLDLREATTVRDLDREDMGWTPLNHLTENRFLHFSRRDLIRFARAIAAQDPNCKQIVRLWVQFGIGTGLTWNSDDKAVQRIISSFWDNPENKRQLRATGQQTSARKMVIDGEVFFGLWGETAADTNIRRIDPIQITDIAYDVDDDETPRWYKRERTVGNESVIEWLQDWQNDQSLPGVDSQGNLVAAASENTPVVYWVSFECIDRRGESLLATAIPWASAHRLFLKARVAVQQAIAQFPRKLKVKGGQAAVNAQKNAIGTSKTSTGQEETNPPHAAGGTFVENLAANLETMKMETGAAAAEKDGNMLLQQLGVGCGVFPHYLGGANAYRLATASSMETPMLKQFLSFASMWVEIYTEILEWLLMRDGMVDPKFEVSAPDVFPVNAESYTKSVAQAVTAMPNLAAIKTLQAEVLQNLRIAKADDALESIEAPEPVPTNPPEDTPDNPEESYVNWQQIALVLSQAAKELELQEAASDG